MARRSLKLVSSTFLCVISITAVGQQPCMSSNASAAAPQTTSAAPAATGRQRISPGTMIQVEMSSDVDAKKARAGDTFRTRLWQDIRSGDKVVLPQKTIIVGHVVEAQPRSKSGAESKLTIAFDKAVLKDGAELALQGVVERVQLSSLAVAAAADANARSYNPGISPGSTTNIAMPTQVPLPGEGGVDPNQLGKPGPSNIRDSSIHVQADPSGATTVLSSEGKSDVKLKHFATLDVRVTHSGE